MKPRTLVIYQIMAVWAHTLAMSQVIVPDKIPTMLCIGGGALISLMILLCHKCPVSAANE